MIMDLETLEGAGIQETEFNAKVEILHMELLNLCDLEQHNGIVVCALVNTLSVVLHDVIPTNGLDRTEFLDRIRADLQANLEGLDRDFSSDH